MFPTSLYRAGDDGDKLHSGIVSSDHGINGAETVILTTFGKGTGIRVEIVEGLGVQSPTPQFTSTGAHF